MGAGERVYVLGCGAIAKELSLVLGQLAGLDVTVDHLPGILHNRPEGIAPAIAQRLATRAGEFDRVILGYADCGTGGSLDALIAQTDNVVRLPGAHCYEFFAGSGDFSAFNDPYTFYLTDYLARHFDLFVWRGLGLDRWPHLRDDYFGNYRRLVYLAQQPTDDLEHRARIAASKLSLEYEFRSTGLSPLAEAITTLTIASSRSASDAC